ncbi:hypothetical protein [Guggenheimella bovis]
MKISRIRDLSLVETKKRLLFATDSAGSIGEKETDQVQTDPKITGFYLARVPILELLCHGAFPKSFILDSCNEWEPTTKRLNEGVMEAFDGLEIDPSYINGSTEENMKSHMTAAAITVFGEVEDDWTPHNVKSGEYVYMIGEPYVGNDVLKNHDIIISTKEVLSLRKNPVINVMIPLGSRGALHELEELGAPYTLLTEEPLDISAGPSTALIFTSFEELSSFKDFGQPVRLIAKVN